MQDEDRVVLYFRIDEADGAASDIASGLREAGAEVTPIESRGLSGLMEAVLAVSVAAHGVLHLVEVTRRMFRRGVVIDGSGDDLVVRSDPNLPPGSVLIRSRDGELTLDERTTLPSALAAELIDRRDRS